MFSFTVTGDVEGADTTVIGTAVGAVNGAACTTDFVVIPNPIVTSTNVAVGTDRFCGLGFVSVQCKFYLIIYFKCTYKERRLYITYNI